MSNIQKIPDQQNNPIIFTGSRKAAKRLLFKLIFDLSNNVNNSKPGYCWATANTLRRILANNHGIDRSLSHIYFLLRDLEREGWIHCRWISSSSYRYIQPTNPLEALIRKGNFATLLFQVRTFKDYEPWRVEQGLTKQALTGHLIEFFQFLKDRDRLKIYSTRALWTYFKNNYLKRRELRKAKAQAEAHKAANSPKSWPRITGVPQLQRLQQECKTKSDMLSLIVWARRHGFNLIEPKPGQFLWVNTRGPT